MTHVLPIFQKNHFFFSWCKKYGDGKLSYKFWASKINLIDIESTIEIDQTSDNEEWTNERIPQSANIIFDKHFEAILIAPKHIKIYIISEVGNKK